MSLLSFVKKKRSKGSEKKSEKKAKISQVEKTEAKSPVASNIDLHVLLTEKAVKLQEQNVVTFRVATGVSKGQIARAVKMRYNVNPKKVRTVSVSAKQRRRGQTVGQTAAWKKAYVEVDDVQSFNIGV